MTERTMIEAISSPKIEIGERMLVASETFSPGLPSPGVADLQLARARHQESIGAASLAAAASAVRRVTVASASR
jgi:hypothetical protein